MTTVIEGVRAPAPGDPARTWYVDGVRPDDRPALHALYAACSAESATLRFFTRLPELPRAYVDGALAGRPEAHDALVVRHRDRPGLAALASLVAGPDTAAGEAELGVLVADAWQRRGMGTALVETLLDRARERGVRRVSACVATGRHPLLAALSRRLQLQSAERDGESLTALYRLGPP